MKYALVIFCFLVFSCKEQDAKEESLAVNNKKEVETERKNESPLDSDYDLKVYNYEELKPYLSTDDDKVYVINFWATWCKPCIKELPYFEELNKNYKQDNVEVILVSLDFPSKYQSHLIPYIEDNKLQSEVVALNDPDSNSWIPQVSEDWSGAIPATLIYNKSNRKFYEGSFTYEELITAVKPFMK